MTTAGILSDQQILLSLQAGDIKIDPFEPAQLNPVSYDLTLGDEVAVYVPWVWVEKQLTGPEDGRFFQAVEKVIDVKQEPTVERFKIDPKRGWVLKPGIGYLMHTRERIRTEQLVPIVDGKSSIGRLFMLVHFTAGFGDPGFDGQYTLEVSVAHPLRVYPGMRIGQVRFHTILGEVQKLYDRTGHYVGKAAEGAVPSQAWKQFQR